MSDSSEVVVSLLVNIDVGELATAIEFYTTGLGLTVRRRLAPDIVELRGGSSPIFLTEYPAGTQPCPGAPRSREYRRHWTPVHLDFVVSELEPAIRRAESAGAKPEGAIREFPWGRYIVMADPFGNGFCLLQFQGAGYASLEPSGNT
jgi:predicted enzyme related to lactoylglutathione lyase